LTRSTDHLNKNNNNNLTLFDLKGLLNLSYSYLVRQLTAMSITLTAHNIKGVADKAKASNVNLYNEMGRVSAQTEKGAESYSVSGDPRVDLFFKAVRNMPCANFTATEATEGTEESKEKYFEFLLEECWKSSPLDTLRLGFYIRDCRGGKGEKLLFRAFCRWLLREHLHDLRTNMEHIPFYGSWKDLLIVFLGTPQESRAILQLANQLRADKAKLGTNEDKDITLAAKYAPNESGAFDKKFKVVAKLCSVLGVNKKQYRTDYLRPLRERSNIVEEQMCARGWDEIDYSKIPSIAGKRYKKAFVKHDKKRYDAFLASVMKGEKKMNVGVLQPHEIVKPYISGYDSLNPTRDDTVEAQWKQFVADRRDRRTKLVESGTDVPNILPIIDVSGSMFGTQGRKNSVAPINVSVAMGLFLSLMNDEKSPFYRKWMTFSTNPKMETLKGNLLCEIMGNLDTNNWEASTRLQPVFDLILDTANMYDVPADRMPKMIVVLSDMQFNQCVTDISGKSNSYYGRNTFVAQITNWEAIEKKYAKSGYTRPTIVFWNLRGDTLNFPVTDKVPNTALVGGFSADILNLLMDGNVPNPYEVMRKAIDNPRYSRVVVHETSGEKSKGKE
jgi:hypothetical protein